METKVSYSRVLKVTSPLMYGEDVRAVQNKLNSLGHNAGTADGYYGNNSAEAAKRFQKSSALTVDGMIGPATWNKLFGANGYKYEHKVVNGLNFHIIEANLDRIETETILKPLSSTNYIGLNGGFFDAKQGYNNPPTSGSSICYNHEDVGKYVTVGSAKRIANFHENQNNDVAVDQRTLIIYRSGSTVTYKIQNMKHVNTAFNSVGQANVLNVIGGISPELTGGTAALGASRSAISVKDSKAYLLYCPNTVSQSAFNKALDTGLGRGLTRANTVMMDGSGSAGMKNTAQFIGMEKRYLYNIIRVKM
ncbi:MAG: peptidoglycan-binding domain-containing protein [Peptostreptococcaceae bacterium]